MRTLKFTLLISTLFLLTTSCTDLTEDIVPNNTVNQTELVTSTNVPTDGTSDDGTGGTTDLDTGGGDGDGGGDGGTKGN
ncbi:hypothetical protein CSC81_00050 [Tenacibaculum discolor]|uniref:Uncharacterized protein n=1 Tax=Tenacibaculum discolor TaxID=361581 RepID=A0A2G1BYE0_9FLAO|nr:hypothetical protein [Tenacibaculum discolor]MDP2541503.1 hypothetical protein [Tenacibaculum discolor]PHN99050.1 hypothetical protein CSC81_00050 [Tenacibaculum discolor]